MEVQLQSKALGISLAVSAGLGLVGVTLWNIMGLESKEVAEVSGFLDAVAVAKQQRVCECALCALPPDGWF